ncbi:MAG: chorismate mutase [Flavobacteriales bacterium]
MAIEQLTSWSGHSNKPFIIAGPCSAETEHQVVETALRLKATDKVHLLRAGIWKPRTRPDSFEGVGEKGLPWLAEAKAQTGFKTCVEVANSKHAELAMKHGVDVLWVGARTTVNPFSVQDIADAVTGVDIPVMVKNPINPDIALWMGGIERFEKAGITKLAGIHRGFSDYSESIYRNKPLWQLPIELRRVRPDIPLINDPSHICGRRDLLARVSQKAMDLNFDGLMIESHITPDDAWSDAAQQVTPEAFSNLVDALVLRKRDNTDPKYIEAISSWRAEIDEIDQRLFHLLAERMKAVKEIGEFKKDEGITILQDERWKNIFEQALTKADSYGLSPEFITNYLRAVHDESINNQEGIMNS